MIVQISGFRDQLIAAPLKRFTEWQEKHEKVRFPRSIDRGPIEAYNVYTKSLHINSRFRDQLIAAPLKRDIARWIHAPTGEVSAIN